MPVILITVIPGDSGHSASGKSVTSTLVSRHLLDLSKATKKKSQLQSAILRVDNVLKAFGHAATPHNSDASGFAKYVEYQFDNEGECRDIYL